MTNDDNPSDEARAPQDRLRHLTRDIERPPTTINPFYSKFIRRMRLVLPIVALGITAIVLTWNNGRNDKILKNAQNAAPKTIGKNELINPHFDDKDDKGQPYTITALRATQDDKNEDLMHLDQPKGDIQLNDGHWMAIQSKQGEFQRMNRQLLLQQDVTLFRDGGYQMTMAELHVDMNAKTAHSDSDIHGEGPAGTLEAKGLDGDSINGNLIFKGPATLTLHPEAFKSEPPNDNPGDEETKP